MLRTRPAIALLAQQRRQLGRCRPVEPRRARLAFRLACAMCSAASLRGSSNWAGSTASVQGTSGLRMPAARRHRPRDWHRYALQGPASAVPLRRAVRTRMQAAGAHPFFGWTGVAALGLASLDAHQAATAGAAAATGTDDTHATTARSANRVSSAAQSYAVRVPESQPETRRCADAAHDAAGAS